MVSTMRSALVWSDFAGDGLPKMQVTSVTVEFVFDVVASTMQETYTVLSNAYIPQTPPKMVSLYCINEYIIRAPETNMVSTTFPTLQGLTFDVSSMPMFSTKIAVAASGKETRTTFWEDPLWEFTVGFDYLPDATNDKTTAYKNLAGFFMEMGGRFRNFLFKPTNQSKAEDVVLGAGDGVNPEFVMFREYGNFQEPIGQADPTNTFIWVNGTVFSGTVTAGVINPHADLTAVALVHRTSSPVGNLTQVVGPPGVNQYSVDLTTGVFTFNAADEGKNMQITCDYLATPTTDYAIVMPRTVLFVNAPPTGTTVIGTYEYFFVCRFKEDQASFNQFMNRLYELDEITLRSQHI